MWDPGAAPSVPEVKASSLEGQPGWTGLQGSSANYRLHTPGAGRARRPVLGSGGHAGDRWVGMPAPRRRFCPTHRLSIWSFLVADQLLLRHRSFAAAATGPGPSEEGRAAGGVGRPCLGSPRARGPQLAAARVPTRPPEGLWRGSGRPVRRLPAGLAKESEPPSGTARPKANSRGRPRAGTRSRGPALASGEMSPLRPRCPEPPPSLQAGAPTSSTEGARGGQHLRRTTQGRPARRPQRSHPPPRVRSGRP